MISLPFQLQKKTPPVGGVFKVNHTSRLLKSASSSEMRIFWGQTASQERHPIQAVGRLSGGSQLMEPMGI